ncbi:MAG: hypothetical protein MUO82_06415, partial [Candidatus Thermoplasmatota archaeon]|nr:hypothetical protein [Candidatus Thermoplasmatota archaeon]
FFDGIKGNETAISAGGPIQKIKNSATASSAGGRKIIPPLSTQKEVNYLVERYIEQTSQMDRTIANKLKLSSPRVIGLIFIPGEISNSGFNLNASFDSLYPQSIGNLNQLSKLIM